MFFKVLFVLILGLLLIAPVGFRLAFALDLGGQVATIRAANYRPARRYFEFEISKA